jgi:hypothetical protein
MLVNLTTVALMLTSCTLSASLTHIVMVTDMTDTEIAQILRSKVVPPIKLCKELQTRESYIRWFTECNSKKQIQYILPVKGK